MSETGINYKQEKFTIVSNKIVHSVPSTLHSTLAILLGYRLKDEPAQCMDNTHIKQVQLVKPHEDHILLKSLSP
jgi:hypothetical protein